MARRGFSTESMTSPRHFSAVGTTCVFLTYSTHCISISIVVVALNRRVPISPLLRSELPRSGRTELPGALIAEKRAKRTETGKGPNKPTFSDCPPPIAASVHIQAAMAVSTYFLVVVRVELTVHCVYRVGVHLLCAQRSGHAP